MLPILPYLIHNQVNPAQKLKSNPHMYMHTEFVLDNSILSKSVCVGGDSFGVTAAFIYRW